MMLMYFGKLNGCTYETIILLLSFLLLLLHLFPLLCGVGVSYETPPSRPVLRVLL